MSRPYFGRRFRGRGYRRWQRRQLRRKFGLNKSQVRNVMRRVRKDFRR